MKKCGIILAIFMASTSAVAGEWDMSDWGNSGNPIVVSEPETAKPVPEKPMDYPADFHVNDFNAKPWLRDFEVVVVVNKATTGKEAQTVRAYINGKVLRLHEVLEFEQALNSQETDPEKFADRSRRIQELN